MTLDICSEITFLNIRIGTYMAEIKFKNSKKIVAIEGRKQIGYLTFDYACDASKKRNIEAYCMYVKPKYRHLGVGTALLQFLIKNNTEATWISFWTGKEIEKCKKTELFERNGFTKIAYQEDYYENGIGTSLYVLKRN